MVLDIGAGSGLLSMMAARAGADSVVAVELSGHMCDVAEQVISSNGLSSKVVVLQRDSRRMFAATSEGLRAGRKPDGEAPELVRQADVLVFEVFDSGLIGEGALHLTALAQHRLLLPDATVIPASARVFCQPIQFRHERCCGVDVQQLNQYSWRADYDGVELAAVQEQWCALADPVQIFEFNFANAPAHVEPAALVLHVSATGSGVVNALAVWFELQLDEHEVLTTSPHSTGKGATWQNAVMFVPEMRVAPGDELCIEASHDTYSISATVRPAPAVRLLTGAVGADASSAGAACGRRQRSDVDGRAAVRPRVAQGARHNGGRQRANHEEHRPVAHRAPPCSDRRHAPWQPARRRGAGGGCGSCILHAYVLLKRCEGSRTRLRAV